MQFEFNWESQVIDWYWSNACWIFGGYCANFSSFVCWIRIIISAASPRVYELYALYRAVVLVVDVVVFFDDNYLFFWEGIYTKWC